MFDTAAIDRFAATAADSTMRAGVEWITTNRPDLTEQILADDDLVDLLRSELRSVLDSALDDAKEAFDLGMTQVAEATFFSTMRLAGISAATLWAEARS